MVLAGEDTDLHISESYPLSELCRLLIDACEIEKLFADFVFVAFLMKLIPCICCSLDIGAVNSIPSACFTDVFP